MLEVAQKRKELMMTKELNEQKSKKKRKRKGNQDDVVSDTEENIQRNIMRVNSGSLANAALPPQPQIDIIDLAMDGIQENNVKFDG